MLRCFVLALVGIAWTGETLAQTASVTGYVESVQNVANQNWYVAESDKLEVEWTVRITGHASEAKIVTADMRMERCEDGSLRAGWSTWVEAQPAQFTYFYPTIYGFAENPYWGTEYCASVEVDAGAWDYSPYFWPQF